MSCCRLCLSPNSLNPIFQKPSQEKKYSCIIYLVTGLNITMQDKLPKQLCTECIKFINRSLEFRNKCYQANKFLLQQSKLGRSWKRNRINDQIQVNSKIIKSEDSSTEIGRHETELNNLARDISIDSQEEDEKIKCEPENNILSDDEGGIDDFDAVIHESEENRDRSDIKPLKDKKRSCVKTEERKRGRFKRNKTQVGERKCAKPKIKETKSTSVEEKDELKDRNKEIAQEHTECDICHKKILTKGYRNHYKKHTGFDYVCEHCGKKFATRSVLLNHCRAMHGYERKDKCSFCDYTGCSSEQVRIHERLHTGEKPYKCKDCGAGFHRQSNYTQHVAVHLTEKTVKCDQCPRLFKSVRFMRTHKQKAHKMSPYVHKCKICNKQYMRRFDASVHMKKVHGSTDLTQLERVVARVRK